MPQKVTITITDDEHDPNSAKCSFLFDPPLDDNTNSAAVALAERMMSAAKRAGAEDEADE